MMGSDCLDRNSDEAQHCVLCVYVEWLVVFCFDIIRDEGDREEYIHSWWYECDGGWCFGLCLNRERREKEEEIVSEYEMDGWTLGNDKSGSIERDLPGYRADP